MAFDENSIQIYHLNKHQHSTLIDTVFFGSIKLFTLFCGLLCVGTYLWREYDEPTVLYLIIFWFLASAELYRENGQTLSTETTKKSQEIS